MINKVKHEIYTREIKIRFGYITVSFFLSLGVAYYKATQLIYLFVSLCNVDHSFNSKITFIFTDVREAFSATFLVCVVFSVLALSFFLVYSFLCFFSPGWFIHERTAKISIACFLFFLCICYILWVHLFLIPKIYYFFFTFQIKDIDCFSLTAKPRIYSYVVWEIWFLALAFFFFAIILILISCIVKGKIKLNNWSKYRKARFFGSVLLASLLSPPELLIQSLITLLVFFLFELIVFFAFIHNSFVNKKFTKILHT